MPHTPFNGDTFIGDEIRKLIFRFKIKTVVETGTWSAHTTREFAKMCPNVITIDATWNHLIEEFGHTAVDDLIQLGIHPVLGDSSKCLESVVFIHAKAPILMYFDAHGGGENNSNVNPLEAEFRQVASSWKCLDNCVIVVHDFYVPGKDFGYNWGGWGPNGEAVPLSYDVIKPWVECVYPKGHSYHYNNVANGLQRGIIYIYPHTDKV